MDYYYLYIKGETVKIQREGKRIHLNIRETFSRYLIFFSKEIIKIRIEFG